MDYNINIRQNQLENFQQFIDSAKSNLKTLFNTLGWQKDLVMKEDHLVTCLFDKAHRVAAKNLQKHLSSCSLKKAGYTACDIQLSEPSGNKKSSLLLDNATKNDLFAKAEKQAQEFKSGWNGDDVEPKTADRLMNAYTSDERLALYNFAVFATDGPQVPPEFDLSQPSPDEKEQTYEERLENERNAKRRRIKYKSVHTNKKNHTEVIREVIGNQMDLYQEYLTLKLANSKKDDNHPTRVSPPSLKPSQPESINGSFDETRSTASKHSTHSAASSRSKSNRYPSGNNSDHRDRRDNGHYDKRRNGESGRRYHKDSDYRDERRHSRERNSNYRKFDRHCERSRSRSVFREKSRDERDQRRGTYIRDHHREKSVVYEKHDKNGFKGSNKDREGLYKDKRDYQRAHKDDSGDRDHDRRKRKISGDNYSNDTKIRRSRFS